MGRMLRFGVVGVLNTALGYAVILAMLGAGQGDIAANMAGYAAGLLTSLILNARWTFARPGGHGLSVVPRFAAAWMAAYGANLAVVLLARSLGLVESPLVHLGAVGVHAGLFYWMSARFVFAAHRP